MKAKVQAAEEELNSVQAELMECRSRELGVGLDGEKGRKKGGGKSGGRKGEADSSEGGAAGGLHGQLMESRDNSVSWMES